MRPDRRSLTERLVTLAVAVALLAIAIRFAVHVIAALWVPLVIIGGCLLAVAAVVTFLRRTRGW